MTSEEAERFILANTSVAAPPLLSPEHVEGPKGPEIRLHLASEAHELWLKTEDELAGIGLPPPFWAFAWAGGQGLARFLIDRPETVRGKRVLDFASGSGMVAIAAIKAGAARVLAADTDPFARVAVALNAALNGVSIGFTQRDMIGEDIDAEVLLAGDIFYDRELAARVKPWFERLSAQGVAILVGDPGRSYFPPETFEALATYQVPVTRALEDAEVKRTTVWTWRDEPRRPWDDHGLGRAK